MLENGLYTLQMVDLCVMFLATQENDENLANYVKEKLNSELISRISEVVQGIFSLNDGSFSNLIRICLQFGRRL